MAKKPFSGIFGNQLIKILLLLLALFVALSFFFLFRVSHEINALERERILIHAQSAVALINGTQIASLKGNESDLTNPEYMNMRTHLIRLRKSDPLIRFAYLMRRTEDGKYIFLLNSEPLDSKEYSPPGQEYSEITEEMTRPFLQGISLVIGPRTDRRGTWISAMVPIRDEKTNQVEAVLGIDYPVGAWHSLILKRIGYIAILILAFTSLITAIIVVGLEIVKMRRLNQKMKEDEHQLSVFLDQLPGMAFKCQTDPDLIITFTSKGCEDLTGYPPEMLIDNKGFHFNDLIAPEYRESLYDNFKLKAAEQKNLQNEFEIITKDESRKWVLGYGQFIPGEKGPPPSLEGIMLDITEKKRIEEEKRYLDDHDSLTDLYNRHYFLETIAHFEARQSYPVSFIVGNVNGLSLFNGAFGEKAGDDLLHKAGELFLRFAPEGTVAARLQSDEFALAIPFASKDVVQTVVTSITEGLAQCHNSDILAEKYLDLSLGYASSDTVSGELPDVLKSAKNMLYHARLLNRASDTHGILKSLLTTLYERSGETEEHSTRLACISTKIGECLGLPEEDLNKLRLLSMLHDIGKIGVDDRILKKPDPLTEDEWKIMKTHPQIGYRIAMASSGLSDIAPYILAHHERWDGKGYPRGIKGEEIPLLARILCIADAFDAMTSERVYKKAWEEERALEELKKNRGTQFDPKIVDIFLSVVKSTDFNCPDDV
jgi:diguanylate cyclase (GGDEF)-like protein/PAS domain S-box-containing protein